MKAPFPWFGGKSRVAHIVWRAFGEVRNYVEPFFGSGAVLLNRPTPFSGAETINDKDGFVANFWRALQADPDAVARYADNPVNENDLHARHVWLIERRDSLVPRLEGDPCFYDAQIAGWWVWGICCWIGSGWCSAKGPWWVNERDGHRVLANVGHGTKRKLVHLGNEGQGVNRQLVHLGDEGRGEALRAYLRELSARLRGVRVACGDWSRVTGPTPTRVGSPCGVFLDPPYSDAERCGDVYSHDDQSVSAKVRAWAIAHGDDPRLRIALCGYDGEHAMPSSWECVPWKAQGGYGNRSGNDNCNRERIWFSPHCNRIVETKADEQPVLWEV